MAEAISTYEIGPEDAGKPMSLDEFARVEGRPGHLYELSRGVIVVVDVPDVYHERVKGVIRDALVLYRVAHPGCINLMAEGSGYALRLPGMQSERHPDWAIYLNPPPVDVPQPWNFWIPEIVIEIVSEGGEERDYVEKREDYLRAGVRLYWIVDPQQRTAMALTRRGDLWQEQRVGEPATLATPLLPGFELRLQDVFAVL
ncbi:MAG TPA: Uma2 family endonuclease [Phycisphaerae bacterium]